MNDKGISTLAIMLLLLLLGAAVSIPVALYKPKDELTGTGFQDHSNKGPTPVPEPASIFMVGTGLVGAAIYGRKKK